MPVVGMPSPLRGIISPREHETLKGNTPAMASGLSDHVWTIKGLIERAGETLAMRGKKWLQGRAILKLTGICCSRF
jgi:hypothetical protein